ncbi:MAG: zinc-ribbon domain-containing protein [Coriobacteriales bacterium]|jgi:uncharacterized Zn finger protein (UPF0148 family)|nr:zinc-ribbon domain-containing protein [Coriobacteriales bacterium]
MLCTKCGAEVSDAAVFCPYCGTKQDEARENFNNVEKSDAQDLVSAEPAIAEPVAAAVDVPLAPWSADMDSSVDISKKSVADSKSTFAEEVNKTNGQVFSPGQNQTVGSAPAPVYAAPPAPVSAYGYEPAPAAVTSAQAAPIAVQGMGQVPVPGQAQPGDLQPNVQGFAPPQPYGSAVQQQGFQQIGSGATDLAGTTPAGTSVFSTSYNASNPSQTGAFGTPTTGLPGTQTGAYGTPGTQAPFVPPQPQVIGSAPYQVPAEQPKKSKAWIIILVAVVVFICCICPVISGIILWNSPDFQREYQSALSSSGSQSLNLLNDNSSSGYSSPSVSANTHSGTSTKGTGKLFTENEYVKITMGSASSTYLALYVDVSVENKSKKDIEVILTDSEINSDSSAFVYLQNEDVKAGTTLNTVLVIYDFSSLSEIDSLQSTLLVFETKTSRELGSYSVTYEYTETV